jgi:hypothetical protein
LCSLCERQPRVKNLSPEALGLVQEVIRISVGFRHDVGHLELERRWALHLALVRPNGSGVDSASVSGIPEKQNLAQKDPCRMRKPELRFSGFLGISDLKEGSMLAG